MEAIQGITVAAQGRSELTEYIDDWLQSEQGTRLKNYVFALANRHGFTPADKQDCWQDVQMALHINVVNEKYDSSKGTLFDYGKGIARNKVSQILKLYYVRPDDTSSQEISGPSSNGHFRNHPSNPESILVQGETIAQRAQRVNAVFTELKPEDADIVQRRFYQGERISDIAAANGVKPSAMRKRFSRLMKRLRSRIPPD